jgi:hypothetical protein
VFEPDGDGSLMQVPSEFLKCVAYLYTKRGRKYQPEATTFFVSVDYENRTAYHVYAVTAKHVLTGIEKEGCKEIYFRLNFSNKPTDYMKVAISKWWFLGIAVVTPASKIMEILDRQELQAMRRNTEGKAQQKNFPTRDRVS